MTASIKNDFNPENVIIKYHLFGFKIFDVPGFIPPELFLICPFHNLPNDPWKCCGFLDWINWARKVSLIGLIL